MSGFSLRTAFNAGVVGFCGLGTGIALGTHQPGWAALCALSTVVMTIGARRSPGFWADANTAGAVNVHPTENDTVAKGKTAPEIGDEMTDGTTYAGISPDTHKPIYARPKDESGTYSFNEAAKQAENIGHGFRVPTQNELNVLYKNRNEGKLKGTYNETGSNPAGWYWSSTPTSNLTAWSQRFCDGRQYYDIRYLHFSLRLVR